ncbi:MAG: hypothetical protein KAX38_06595 [Candidatus Krumholzibacteria bacterium]|nr:hypothetical protein [Candidatus Krumholzibacteria bacterium]
MIKHLLTLIAMMVVLSISCTPASTGPIGLSVTGGIGTGYYSMKAMNDHINEVRQDLGTALDDLSSGINVSLRGRLWFFERYAVSVGYEHFWGYTETESGDYTVTFKAPADIYSVGGVMNVISFPNLIDLNIGISRCVARSVYGSNMLTMGMLKEYKAIDSGYELYAEATTNFLRPVEVGFQLGYRGLKVKDLEDKFGDRACFPGSDIKVELDYSGVFFYLTAGIRL